MAKQRNKEGHENLMWAIIANMDWSTRCKQRRAYETIKIEFMRTYNQTMGVKLNKFVTARFNELYETVNAWEHVHDKIAGNYGGDDSFSDMLYHVIGSGKNKFNAVMKNPSKLDNVEFTESFAYCIPHVNGSMNDYEKLEPDFHVERAKAAIKALAEVATSDGLGHDKAMVVRELFGRFMAIIAGNYPEAFMDIDHDNDYNRFCNIHDNYSAMFANYLFDAKKYLE